jgi:cytochrome b561
MGRMDRIDVAQAGCHTSSSMIAACSRKRSSSQEAEMAISSSPARYSIAIITAHWTILVLIAVAYLSGELGEDLPKGSGTRELADQLHVAAGLIVLPLAAASVLAVLSSHYPAIIPPPPRWQTIAARTVHVALLVFMIAMPVTGWLLLNAEGEPVAVLGIELPTLLAPDKETAESMEEAPPSVIS